MFTPRCTNIYPPPVCPRPLSPFPHFRVSPPSNVYPVIESKRISVLVKLIFRLYTIGSTSTYCPKQTKHRICVHIHVCVWLPKSKPCSIWAVRIKLNTLTIFKYNYFLHAQPKREKTLEYNSPNSSSRYGPWLFITDEYLIENIYSDWFLLSSFLYSFSG